MNLERFVDYHLDQQNARQWRPFLAAFAEELGDQIPVEDLRGLMRAVGRRMGRDFALPPCDSLQDVENALNAIWRDLHWGWVELQEFDDYVCIQHLSSPLVAAFGASAAEWAPALLEGVYSQLFARLGAADDLVVSQFGEIPPRGEVIEFRLQGR